MTNDAIFFAIAPTPSTAPLPCDVAKEKKKSCDFNSIVFLTVRNGKRIASFFLNWVAQPSEKVCRISNLLAFSCLGLNYPNDLNYSHDLNYLTQ